MDGLARPAFLETFCLGGGRSPTAGRTGRWGRGDRMRGGGSDSGGSKSPRPQRPIRLPSEV